LTASGESTKLSESKENGGYLNYFPVLRVVNEEEVCDG
jgi:hypothetical protein